MVQVRSSRACARIGSGEGTVGKLLNDARFEDPTILVEYSKELKQRAVRAQVGAEDLRSVAQAVCFDIVARELRRVRLQLDADGGRLLQRTQQQHRQHARAAAEVGNAPCAALRRKIGQQHAVRAEGKPRAGAHKARSAGPQVVKYRLGHGARSFRCRHIDRGDMQLAYRLIRLRCSPSGT